MPTYAYRCEECGESFERIESISEHGTAKPACPEVRQRQDRERAHRVRRGNRKKS